MVQAHQGLCAIAHITNIAPLRTPNGIKLPHKYKKLPYTPQSLTSLTSLPTMPTFKTLSAASRAPLEIIDHIVRNARTTDLESYSLVSSTWVGPCQRHLFSAVRVDPGEYHPIYDQGARFWQHIRWLTFVERTHEPLSTEAIIERPFPVRVPVGPDHAKFPAFLHGLTQIRSLCIHRIRWSVLSAAALQGLAKMFSQPIFKQLVVFPNDSWEGFPLALLRHCPGLRLLALLHPEPSGTEVPPSFRYLPGLPTGPSASPLRILDLTLEGGKTINSFLRLVEGQDEEQDGGKKKEAHVSEESGHEDMEESHGESWEGHQGEGGEEQNEQEDSQGLIYNAQRLVDDGRVPVYDGRGPVDDQDWCGLVQLDQLSRLCLGYLDGDVDQKDNVSRLLKRCGASLVSLTLRFELLGCELGQGSWFMIGTHRNGKQTKRSRAMASQGAQRML